MGYYSKVFSHQKNIPLIRFFLVVLYRIGSTLTPFGFACMLSSIRELEIISLKASPKKQQNVRCQSQESTAMYLQKNRHWGKCRNADPPGCSNMNTWPNATSSQHMMIDLGSIVIQHQIIPFYHIESPVVGQALETVTHFLDLIQHLHLLFFSNAQLQQLSPTGWNSHSRASIGNGHTLFRSDPASS